MSEIKDVFLTRKEAANYLTSLGYTISQQTLAHMAANRNARKGPPFVKWGWSQVKYRRSDLDAWAKSQMEEIR